MAARQFSFIFALVSASAVLPLHAEPYNEDYHYGASYLPAFANKSNGLDMLPMTGDDPPVTLNLGGSLSFDIIDLNGNTGGINLDWTLHNRKNDDDQELSSTSHSEFNLGIIAEGENWCDMRQDNGAGATGNGPDGSVVPWAINRDWDWELNDSSSPDYAGWGDASDYFWYNNNAPNQRGLGGSRYYFEYKNPAQYPGTPIFDEPEAYRRANRLRHTWAADPGNGESLTYFARDFNLEIRGFLIPVSAIHTLPHGSLSPLFGWQSVDMADYVRTVIGAMIDTNGNPLAGLEVWDEEAGGYNNAEGDNPPPFKYVYIVQTSDVITLGPPGTNVAAAAAYYGVTEGVSGLRRCHIGFKGDSATNLPIDLTPPAGSMRNSWGRDDFIRNSYTGSSALGFTACGNLQTGTACNAPDGWNLFGDSPAVDGRAIQLPAATPAAQAWAKLPTMKLPAKLLGTVQGKAQLRIETGNLNTLIHIALTSGTDAVASGVLKVGRPATVALGGTTVGGPVSGSTGSTEGPIPDTDNDGDVDGVDHDAFVACGGRATVHTVAGSCVDLDMDDDLDIDMDDHGIFQLCISGSGNPFNQNCAPGIHTRFLPSSNYVELALSYNASAGTVSLTVDGTPAASYTGGPAGAYVDGVYVWTNSAEALYIDTLSVYSGAFTCPTGGDVDGDGDSDGDDATARQACYSGHGKPYRTGIFPSCACLDLDGDFDVDELDGVPPQQNAMYKDDTDAGNDAFNAGCHWQYSDGLCTQNKTFSSGDQCLGTIDLKEWTNQNCHPFAPVDLVVHNCLSECIQMGFPGGSCQPVLNHCGPGLDSARCVCDPPE